MSAILDTLDVGLVTVDPQRDFAHVNGAAATLLDIPPGVTTATAFSAFIRDLAGKALNRAEAEAAVEAVAEDPAAEFNVTVLFPTPRTHLGMVSKPAPAPWLSGRIWAFYDNTFIAQAMDSANRANALIRASSDATLDPQVVLEGVWRDGTVVDLIYRDVNRATCEYLGLSRDQLVGHSLLDSLPNIDGSGLLAYYTRCAQTGIPVILDDFPYYNEVLEDARYYDVRANQIQSGWVTLTWRDVTERTEWARRIAASEERFRLLAANVGDVVLRLDDDGTITWISNSVDAALGAPAEHWIGQSASVIVPTDRAATYDYRLTSVVRGATHMGRTRVVGADGVPHWIHLHVKPFYEADGTPNGMVASFRLIDDEVAAETRAQELIDHRDAQNRSLARRLQDQTSRLMAELNSAARYVASILPGDLDGPARVSSCYAPSRQLGGDSYDYRWIDDDHLIVYLVDVSGHGVEAAMVSVSVHNLLRADTLPQDTLLNPAVALHELNRLFQMDHHGGNYFTAWYGVYQASTRTLRYSSAGHPPALVLSDRRPGEVLAELSTNALPVGVFDDTEFETRTYVVPPEATLLLYSDGAFEFQLREGRWCSLADFVDVCTRTCGTTGWSLDSLIGALTASSLSGLFEDDCTLVRVCIR
jgi:PAS domain S-box-containing protein